MKYLTPEIPAQLTEPVEKPVLTGRATGIDVAQLLIDYEAAVDEGNAKLAGIRCVVEGWAAEAPTLADPRIARHDCNNAPSRND